MLKPYIEGYHLSDNNGLQDSNSEFTKKSWFYSKMKKNIKYISIEVYTKNLKKLRSLQNLIRKNMTTNIKDFTIKLPQNLNNILKKIDKNLKGLVFIVNEKNKLLGSISDGDIRRGLIKKNIEQRVKINSKFVNTKPFCLNYKTRYKNNSLSFTKQKK